MRNSVLSLQIFQLPTTPSYHILLSLFSCFVFSENQCAQLHENLRHWRENCVTRGMMKGSWRRLRPGGGGGAGSLAELKKSAGPSDARSEFSPPKLSPWSAQTRVMRLNLEPCWTLRMEINYYVITWVVLVENGTGVKCDVSLEDVRSESIA